MFFFRISSGDFWCVLGVGLVTQQSLGVPQVYSLNVCLHTHVWEKKTHQRKCHYTPTLSSLLQLPSSFQATQIKLVWWLSLTRCRVLWQPSATAVRGELNLRPLSASTRHGAPCGVKEAFALFPGLPVDAWCTVASGGLFSCRTHHNVNIRMSGCDIMSCKTAAGIKPHKFFGCLGKLNVYFRNNQWFESELYSKNCCMGLWNDIQIS